MEKIAILGMGESLNLFNPVYFEMSIGVNDIWKYVKTDVVVCLDRRNVFSHERLQTIDECTPKVFYSQIINWDTKKEFQYISLLPGYPDNFVQFNTPGFHKSFCSPFVACQIAYNYYGAKEIHLFGVDMVNHPHLDKKICEKIKIHFVNLQIALIAKGSKLIVHGEGILKDI